MSLHPAISSTGASAASIALGTTVGTGVSPVSRMSAFSLSRYAVRCLKEGQTQPQTWKQIADRAKHHELSGQFSPSDMSHLLSCFAKLKFRDKALLDTLAQDACLSLSHFKSTDLSFLLSSYAKLNCPKPLLLRLAAREVGRRCHELNTTELAEILNSFAHFGFAHEGLMGIVRQRIAELDWNLATSQGFADKWGTGPGQLSANYEKMLEERKRRNRVGWDLVSVVSSLGKLRWRDEDLLSVVNQHLARNVGFLEPRALALVSYSLFAKLGAGENYFLASLICEEIERKKGDFDPHSTALILQALGACEEQLVLPTKGIGENARSIRSYVDEDSESGMISVSVKMSDGEKRMRLAALRAREDYEEFAKKNIDYVSSESKGLLMPIEKEMSRKEIDEEGGEIRLQKIHAGTVTLDPTSPTDVEDMKPESTGDLYFRERIATKVHGLFEHFADLISRRVPHQRKQWPVQSLTMILNAYSTRYDLETPLEPLFRQIGDVLALQGPHLYPQALASTVQSFAMQGISHGVLFYNAPSLIEDHSYCFSVDQLGQITHAYSLLGMAHTRLFDAVTERIVAGGLEQLIGGGVGEISSRRSLFESEEQGGEIRPRNNGVGLFASSMEKGNALSTTDDIDNNGQTQNNIPSFANRLPAPKLQSLAELLESYVRVTMYEPQVFDLIARAVVVRQKELNPKLSAQILKAVTDASHPVNAEFLLSIAHLVDVGAYLGQKRVRAIGEKLKNKQLIGGEKVALSGFDTNTATIDNMVERGDGNQNLAIEGGAVLLEDGDESRGSESIPELENIDNKVKKEGESEHVDERFKGVELMTPSGGGAWGK